MRLIQHCLRLRFQRSTRIRIRQAGRGGTRGACGFIGVVNVKRLDGNLLDHLRLLLGIPVADNDERFGFDTGKLAIITVKRGRMVIELDINL
ncbi:hypothetical protein [Pantoea ananatis]|uniref:hypothetical protein n=1 Tax=Pantoea ananas TaxID=553 RepID=UPI001FF0ADBA|nr:hypothetical protein [Pantoea ananatis]